MTRAGISSTGMHDHRDVDASLPPGYSRHLSSSYELVVLDELLTAVRPIIEQHGSLYEWAAGLPQATALRGRAPVYVGDLPGVDVCVAVRHVWHGGLLAPLTSDRFRVPTRAPQELANSLRLRAHGIPTTELLAYVLYPAGPGLRRVDVATRFIPDAVDLGMVLSGHAPTISTAAALPAVGVLLQRLAAHGVLHPDLNVKNILLVPSGGHSHTALAIDVDVVQFVAHRGSEAVMQSNLARLLRSVKKWRTRGGSDIDARALAAFEQRCLAHPDRPRS